MREGNKERLKEKETVILDAATELFAEKGFNHASMYEIARKSGVATGLLYSYFESKIDLVLSIFVRFWEELNSQLEEGLNNLKDPREKLNVVLLSICNLLMKDKKALLRARVLNETLPLPHISSMKDKKLRIKRKKLTEENRKFLGVVDKIIEEGQKQGFFCNTLPSSVLRQTLYGAMEMLMYGLFLEVCFKEEIGYDKKDAEKAMKRLIEKFLGA